MNDQVRIEHRGTKWQPDKTINIANIIALLFMFGGLLSWINTWMDREDSRITILEVEQVSAIRNQERIAMDLRDSNMAIKLELRDNQKQVSEALVRIENRQIKQRD